MAASSPASRRAEGAPLLLALPAALLRKVAARLPTRERLLALPLVCRELRDLAEEDCELLCAAHGWQLARRPRGRNAGPTPTPWRRQYLTHACICCCVIGDFCARETSNSHARFILCGPCARSEGGQARLVPGNLKLDITGLSGRPLYTARGDRFCAAMHAEGVKRRGRGVMTLDASGASLAAGAGAGSTRQRPAPKQRRTG
ncbi:hypothetical protein T492DRAFT_865120 [Pavlovales sp. CCMP2436]|nr:hypothetical protein T492DRAFT_865120 [Pavlovales sp. CCMP2436]